jgi:LysR family transcriptional regulator, benzoate and cis,cis-muconate-responsive activator of ben and cat genes
VADADPPKDSSAGIDLLHGGLNVSLRLLRAFVAVASEGNVRRAAARLYVSQPSLSQDIRRLERQVGIPLFDRTTNGMSLTQGGAELLQSIQTALSLIDRGVDQARSVALTSKARVALAFSPSLGNKLLPEVLPAVEAAFEDIVLDEREVDTGEVGPGVRDGRFDLGLAHCPTVDRELELTLVGNERLCVAVPDSHHSASKPRVSLADLADLALLLWPRESAPTYHDYVLRVCSEAGLEPRLAPPARRAIVRSYLITSGQCFALLPESASVLQIPGVVFVRLDDANAVVPLLAVRRTDEQRETILAVERLLVEKISNSLARAQAEDSHPVA